MSDEGQKRNPTIAEVAGAEMLMAHGRAFNDLAHAYKDAVEKRDVQALTNVIDLIAESSRTFGLAMASVGGVMASMKVAMPETVAGDMPPREDMN